MKSELLAKLRAAGVTSILAHYSGSGDEGYINEVEPSRPVPELNDDLLNFFWDEVIANSIHDGFHNDDGGCGHIIWDVTADTITMHHTRYYTSEQHYPPEIIKFEDEE